MKEIVHLYTHDRHLVDTEDIEIAMFMLQEGKNKYDVMKFFRTQTGISVNMLWLSPMQQNKD